jgi:DNA-binding transcriptional ArsR family regulator
MLKALGEPTRLTIYLALLERKHCVRSLSKKLGISESAISQHMKIMKDSVYLKDSTHVSEKGDTVKIEHWHTEFLKKEVHDTTYISKTDTIPQPYPVIKEVPAELNWWQRLKMRAGGLAILLCLLAFLIWVWRTK